MPTARGDFLEAIATIEQLYPGPRTLGRALALLRDPDSDVNDIAALIGRDPALAADVLRRANSAAYGAGVHLSAIDQAVQKIGSRETIRIVGRLVTQGMTNRHLGSYGIDAEDFWAESLFNGIFLQNLARLTEVVDPDDAYICGLLRFIGRLAIDQTIHDCGAGIFWDRVESLAAWENGQVGVTYTEAGGILLRRWQLAEDVALAVEQQDAVESANSTLPLVQMLHFASSVLPPGLDLSFFLAASERPVIVLRQDPFVRANGLSQDMIVDLIEETQRGFAAARDDHYR